LLNPALQRLGPETLRKQVLAGGYRLLDWKADAVEGSLLPHQPLVQLATTGVMIPEVVAAAHTLQKEGVAVNVLNLVSPRRLFEHWQANRPTARALDWLLPPNERHAPIITIQDGASHTLAWLGSIYGTTVFPLGVNTFGQSGTRADLYQHYGIGTEAIVEAAFAALDLSS
jgi:pyruvate dehydrogenase E1 component